MLKKPEAIDLQLQANLARAVAEKTRIVIHYNAATGKQLYATWADPAELCPDREPTARTHEIVISPEVAARLLRLEHVVDGRASDSIG